MNKIKLLLVEDDDSLAFIVKGSLELTGNYDVCVAANGREGLDAYTSFNPDVIVSDIEMPEMSGEEFVSQIRQLDKQTPILFATGKTSPQDLIRGYQLEIDNYIRKPYLCEELDVQIRSVLKRFQKKETVTTASVVSDDSDLHTIGLYLFHAKHRYLQLANSHTKLSEREAQVLWMLYDKRGDLVKREDILTECWKTVDFYTSRSLDVFIRNLRLRFVDDPSVEIVTIRGEGYRLIYSE
jgi:DNA-binding response OmpR family regulator